MSGVGDSLGMSGAGITPGGAAALIRATSRYLTFILTGLNLNLALTDIGTFAGLPTKYRVDRLTVYDASTNLTLATLDLRTAAAGAGSAVVAAYALAGLTAPTKMADATLAIASDYQTVTSLILRNVTAQGAPATVSALLGLYDLT